jgi:APA family basic amino acid/polyamine antiporter
MSEAGNVTGGYATVRREIGVVTATSIVIANIVSTGIFTTTGIISGYLPGSAWVLLCWGFGGLLAIAGALCYAELSTRMPEEGAEYVYLKRLYHPVLGFLTGWTSFIVGFSAAIAAASIAFSEYIYAGIAGNGIVESVSLPLVKKLVAVLIIILFTAVHYVGRKFGSRVQIVLTIVKIAIILGLSGFGLARGSGHLPAVSFGDGGSFNWIAIGTAMMLVMFAYSGWNASAYIAGELKNPRRTLTLSLAVGTLVVIALYMVINLFIFQTLPFGSVRGEITIVERAAVGAFGDWMGRGISLMIAVALMSSLSAYIIIGPRVYFAMARDRLFLPFAAKVHPRYNVPSRSIAIQGTIAVLMVAVGSFEQLLVYLGFALGIFPWLAVFGLFIARRRRIGEETAVKVWGYPVVPGFFLVSMLFLMVIAFLNRPLESSAALVTILVGIPCYLIWVRTVANRRDEVG